MVAEKEDAVVELYESDTLGGVISVENGAVFELFGGYNSGAINHDAKHELAGLGDGERVVFFANWAVNDDYEQRTTELAEVLVESLYALAGRVAQLGGTDELAEFQIQFQMFDQLFRQDLVNLADGLATADDALGNEAALVIDLDAPMPPLPGVPQELVEGGRFLRASGIAPVEERAKLGEGWEKVDAALRSMLKSVKQMGLAEINMLTPTSSEKNDVVTWYFDALAFSDDLKPSVTVSDDWFVASTSRTQALDLVAKAAAGGGAERRGAWMELNLDALRDYAGEMLSLVETHAETLIADEEQRAEFQEALPQVRDALEALGEFEAITFHDRLVDGGRRMTLKFQAR